MLVLTFTEAAAEQMHARIAQQLREAYQQTRDTRLLRQLILLQGANISTIHSFCKRLITEHFHKLSLDPSFRVIDADEAMLLKGETLEETIEWAWRQDHLVQGMHELLQRRDLRGSDGFLGSVIRLSDFLEGVVTPDRWCDRARWLAEQIEPLGSELGDKQQQIIKDRLGTILAQLRVAQRIYEDEVPDGDWGGTMEENLIEPISACLDQLKAKNWQGCAAGIRSFCKPRLSSPKGLAEMAAKVVAGLQKTAVEAFVSLNDLAILNPNYLDVVGRSTSLQTCILIELVQRFNQALRPAKEQSQRPGFRRPGTLHAEAADHRGPLRRAAQSLRDRPGPAPAVPVHLRGRVPGHQPGAAGDPRRPQLGQQRLRRGRRQAEHLRLAWGRAGDLPRPSSSGLARSQRPCSRLSRGPQLQLPLGQGHSGLRQQGLRADHDPRGRPHRLRRGVHAAAGARCRRRRRRRTSVPRQPIVELHILDERGNNRGAQDEEDGEQKSGRRHSVESAIRNPQSAIG